jgi:hypothetical protein
MSKRWTVGIVGAGRMAQGFDQPGDASVLTMAHAVNASPHFALGGFFDIDPARAAAAEKKWGCAPTPRNRSEWFSRNWDVVYISTPDQQHAADLREALDHRPKGILVEKPFVLESRLGDELLRRARDSQIALGVNYPRRWHSGVAQLQGILRDEKIGNPRFATLVYSGGTAHNGVHLLDLFGSLWGTVWQVRSVSWLAHQGIVYLKGPGDLEITCVDIPASGYTVFEMSVYCARGKVTLGGNPETLALAVLEPHPQFPAFQVFRTIHQWDMESESLLLNSLEQLNRWLLDPHQAQVHLSLEIEQHRFISQFLDSLSHAEKELS